MSNRKKILKTAKALGYEIIREGGNHTILEHSKTHNRAIVPQGGKLSFRSLRNILASLRRGARQKKDT